jgi:hypothetical protein
MDDESITFDDVLFDRLVDGELSAAERRELLSSLDGRPSEWRKCALAFLEAQTWRSELVRLVREPAATQDEAAPAVHAEWLLAGRPVSSWLALAATVLIAFSLGLALRDLSLPHPKAAPNPLSPGQFASVTPSLPATANGSPDALTVWVRDESGKPRQLKVPLVDATAMDRQMGLRFQSGVPSAVRSELEQKGYQVESKRRYAPFVLDNGQPLVVPVEDTKIVPVGNRVY